MKIKILVVAVFFAIALNVHAESNRQRVLKRHPEAHCRAIPGFILNTATDKYESGKLWQVTLKPSCGPYAHEWTIVTLNAASTDEAWFTALEWLLAYDYCD